MSKNKGKPSGKDAASKSDAGRKGNYKRSGWPEDAGTQHTANASGKQVGSRSRTEPPEGRTAGRNRKAGGMD